MNKHLGFFVTAAAFSLFSSNVFAVREIINENDFNSILQQNQNVLVDFFSTTCPPCREIGLILGDIESQFQGKVVFIKVNVSILTRIANNFGIRMIPTLVFFSNGNEVGGRRIVGKRSRDDLINHIKSTFSI